MYKLYAREGAGSVVVEALLEEAGASYRVENVESGPDGRCPPSYYAINPLGQVPALVLPGGTVMTESGAIVIHLADQFTALKLAPPIGSPQRPIYLRWMIYLAANIYMSDLRVYYPARYSSDPNHAAAVKKAASAQMAKEWEVFAAALGNGPFILGRDPSAADFYAAMLATWNLDVPGFFRKHPNVRALYDLVVARPVVAKVWARNGMEAWKTQAASA